MVTKMARKIKAVTNVGTKVEAMDTSDVDPVERWPPEPGSCVFG